MNRYQYVLLAILAGFSSNLFASSITYWQFLPLTSSQYSPGHYGSALAACQSYNPNPQATYGLSNNSGTQAWCYRGIYSTYDHVGYVHLKTETCQFGNTGLTCNTSCPAPKQMVDGQCISVAPNVGEDCGTGHHGGVTNFPKVINTAGECVFLSQMDPQTQCKYLARSTRTGYTLVGYDGNSNPINPGSVTQEGCTASVISVDHCKAPAVRQTGSIMLAPAAQPCRVGLSFTGEVADGEPPQFVPPGGGNEGICPPGEDCSLDDLPDITESQPCSYTTDGEGRKVCESFNYHGKPGDGVNCGTVNGKFECIGTKPTSNGISIGTVIEEKSNADGTTTTTKTDVHNKVVCSGVGSCTTQTTTSKTVTIKDGSGKTISQTGTCTGANCAPNGTGGKGDTDGDGIDDCATGADCSEEGTADIPGAPELEEAEEIGDSTGDYFGRIANAPIVAAVTNLAIPTGGSCPVYNAVTMIGTFDSSAFCNLAPELLSGLRFLFLALWAWAAIRLFMTA